jgi:PKD repeat protein
VTTFNNTSTGSGLSFQWNFGDGSPLSTATNPSHTYDSIGTFTVVLTATNSAGSDTASAPVTINSVPPSTGLLYLSLANSGSYAVGAAANVRDEDIVSFDGTNFALVFDGSDVGVGAVDVDAFALVNANTLLMSFDDPVTIGSLGTVDDSDIVQFNATSLGNNTTGTFSLFCVWRLWQR